MTIRQILAWIACISAGVAVAYGCGNKDVDLADGMLATVGGHAITESALGPAIVGRRAFALSAASEVEDIATPAYWLEDLGDCVETISRRPNTHALSTIETRQRCREQAAHARVAALRLLIRGRWYVLETRRLGLHVPHLSREALVSLSTQSRVRLADIAVLAPIYQRRALLLARSKDSAPRFSRKEIARYYEANRKRYVAETAHYIDAVLIATLRQARRVAAGFRRGLSAKELVNRFQRQHAMKPFEGGLLDPAFTNRPALKRATDRLGRGDVSMIRDPGGWYVFRVVNTEPRRASTFEQASGTVMEDLQVKNTKERYRQLDRQLLSRYQGITVCASAYQVPECK